VKAGRVFGGAGRLYPISKAMINIAQMSHKAKWRMSSKRGEVCCGYGSGAKKKPPVWQTDRR
jgi:hypothetical protein